jgi:hypothetical protein
MVPDSQRDAEIMSEAHETARQLINVLSDRARANAADEVELAELAGRELEGYARALLDRLITASDGALEQDGAEWVQRRFHESIGEIGVALRDAIQLSTARHAVAQALQRKVFEAESELRSALERSPARGG